MNVVRCCVGDLGEDLTRDEIWMSRQGIPGRPRPFGLLVFGGSFPRIPRLSLRRQFLHPFLLESYGVFGRTGFWFRYLFLWPRFTPKGMQVDGLFLHVER